LDARIRYISMVSENPEPLAAWYKQYFAMTELGRGDDGEIALTDGFYNLSIVKPHGEDTALGLSHIGLEIDDIHEVEGRLEDFAPHANLRGEPGGLFHGEYRVTDPNGHSVSLSTCHFNMPAEANRHFPNIRHVAFSTQKNQEILDFYMNVFGFREPTTSKRIHGVNDTRFSADGSTAMAILRYPVDQDAQEPAGGWTERHFKAGLNHIGFLVPDIQNFMAGLPKGSISDRPNTRPMTEFRVLDPETNEIDISQHKGYEVDVDVWEHA